MRPVPGWIERRLVIADELCQRARRELLLATEELVDVGWSRREVEALTLRRLHLAPKPTATITNGELARHGLSQHPDAIGVRWDDRGRATWVSCRDCLCRADYIGLPVHEESALLYIGPIHCDVCDESRSGAGVTSEDADHQVDHEDRDRDDRDDLDRADGDTAPATGEGG